MTKHKIVPFDESKQKEENLISDVICSEDVKSSSSPNIYKVTVYNGKISCTCPAGGKRTFCKHMLSIIKKNEDLIKTKNSEFYEKLKKLIMLKGNRYDSQDEYKQLMNELIFVNKAISEKAFDNQLVCEETKLLKKELKIDIRNIVNKYSREKKIDLLEFLKELGVYSTPENTALYAEYPTKLQDFINEEIIICKQIQNNIDNPLFINGIDAIRLRKFAHNFLSVPHEYRTKKEVWNYICTNNLLDKFRNFYTVSLSEDFQMIVRTFYVSLLDELYPKNEDGWRIGYDDYWNRDTYRQVHE